MNTAERIERVLYHAGLSYREGWPEDLYADIDYVVTRYSELKRTKDFTEAARLARVEWIQGELTKFNRECSQFDRDLRDLRKGY